MVRSLGSAASPVIAGHFLQTHALSTLPIVLAGVLKIIYDLALFSQFRKAQPAESSPEATPSDAAPTLPSGTK